MERKIEQPNPAEYGWIEDNLRKARELTGKTGAEEIPLDKLDEAFARWMDQHDPKKEDPNPFINAFGIAFGQYLVDHDDMKWAVVIDDQGTEMAVHGKPGDVLIFPPNFVSKRYVSRQKNFFSLIYPEMKKDIERLKAQGKEELTALSPLGNLDKPWWKFW